MGERIACILSAAVCCPLSIDFFATLLTSATSKPDDSSARLKRIDTEAMESFRKGKLEEGFAKLLDVAKTYQGLTPDNCNAEEALIVAVIYARISAIVGKSLTDEKLKAYLFATQAYSKKGGIAPDDFERWFEQVDSETKAACQKK